MAPPNPWEPAFDQPAAAAAGPNPWEPAFDQASATAAAPWASIDMSQPDDAVIKQIEAIPDEKQRVIARNEWAAQREKKLYANQGILRSINDPIRAFTSGVPGGSYFDEINAAVKSRLPGGMPYEYEQAAEQARNERFAKQNWKTNLGLGLGGAAASTVVAPAGVLGNAGLAAVQGAGEGRIPITEDPWGAVKERATNAARAGTAALALGPLFGGVSRAANKFAETNPQVMDAAKQLGLKLPFFVTAENRNVQAQGRHFGQGPGSEEGGKIWQGAQNATLDRAGQTVDSITGQPIGTAPYATGQTVQRGLQSDIDRGQVQIEKLADETRNVMPPGYTGQVPNTRAAVNDIVSLRTGARETNPQAGLGDYISMATDPKGVSWPSIEYATTKIGKKIGLPGAQSDATTTGELKQIMTGMRADQPNMVQQAVQQTQGPWGGATAANRFEQNVAKQKSLYDRERAITDVMDTNKPEAVITRAADAANVGGSGTHLEQLQLLTSGLNASERQQLGAGVFAHIQNLSKGSPQGVAQRLDAMPQQARDMLFPPGTKIAADVDNLLTVTRRLGDINQLRRVGSAQTEGPMTASNITKGIFGGGAGTLGGVLAHQLGVLPEYLGAVSAAGLVSGGVKMAYDKYGRPYLLQHGLPGGERTAAGISALASGAQRQLPQEFLP